MKTKLLFLFIISLFISCENDTCDCEEEEIPIDYSNQFNDGSFENDNALAYWGLSENETTILDTEIKKEGNTSLHLKPEDFSRNITHQRISELAIGEEYTFSFWIRINGEASECSDLILDFGDLCQWGSKFPFCESLTFRQNEWLYYEITFEALVDRFSFNIYFDTFTDIWIDDLQLNRKEYIE